MEEFRGGAYVPLDPDHVVEAQDFGPGKGVGAVRWTWDEYREYTRGDYVHVVGHEALAGVLVFAQELEQRHFWPPGTPLNEPFKLARTLFADLTFLVVSVPSKYEDAAAFIAKKIGLAVRKTTPVCVKGGMVVVVASTAHYAEPEYAGYDVFPLKGERVRTLEYLNGSPLANAARAGLTDVLRDAEAVHVDISGVRASRQHIDN